MPEVSGTAQFWHFISIRCPKTSSFSILWEQTIERGRHQSLEFSLLLSGECYSPEGFVPGSAFSADVWVPSLVPWSAQIRSRSELGRQPAFKIRAGDSHGWEMWGQKNQRQQKVQTANKVEGLRRQWRKDLGSLPGWRTHVSFSSLQD